VKSKTFWAEGRKTGRVPGPAPKNLVGQGEVYGSKHLETTARDLAALREPEIHRRREPQILGGSSSQHTEEGKKKRCDPPLDGAKGRGRRALLQGEKGKDDRGEEFAVVRREKGYLTTATTGGGSGP